MTWYIIVNMLTAEGKPLKRVFKYRHWEDALSRISSLKHETLIDLKVERREG